MTSGPGRDLTLQRMWMAALGDTALQVAEGSYDPASLVRAVRPGARPTGPLATMVSLHEAFHASLNACTCFGNAMILAGSLAAENRPGFPELLGKMIAASILTHEVYATASGLAAVGRGRLDAGLLQGYPDYLRHLEVYDSLFEADARPGAAFVLLANAARAAMQTSILRALGSREPSTWPGLRLAPRDTPDRRFAVLLDPTILAEARVAFDGAVDRLGVVRAESGRPESRLEEFNAIARSDPGTMALIDRPVFAVMAEALERAGYGRPDFDAQVKEVQPAQLRATDALGSSSRVRFETPEGLDASYAAVRDDFRHEVLSLRAAPLPCVFADLESQGEDAGSLFIHHGEGGRHFQLVVMPYAKAAHLYRLRGGREVLERWAARTLTGLRRAVPGADGTTQIELLLVSPEQVSRIVEEHAPAELVALVSLSALGDADWHARWIGTEHGFEARSLVVIDVDPILVIADLGARPGRMRAFGFGARFPIEGGAPVDIHVVALQHESDPEALFLTPCSAPKASAMLACAAGLDRDVEISKVLPEAWADILRRHLVHLIREEGVFGASFWE